LGQEIAKTRFSKRDFEVFCEHLRQETATLSAWFASGELAEEAPVAGFEVEGWLVDRDLHPAPINEAFLERLNDPLACPELAKFNIELNTTPYPLRGDVLGRLHRELEHTWRKAAGVAHELDAELVLTGILPTVGERDLRLANMSSLKRYRALNEQVLETRGGRPLQLNIVGRQSLRSEHGNVMLESAATSFQIHLQTPARRAHHAYNAAIIASAPMVAASANSPYLFGVDLWDETRIPLFEQAVESGGFGDVAGGPLRRVSFGSGYAQETILECFQENLRHFPPLLPMQFEDAGELPHLRLHNGTIWRWNRPLIGFDRQRHPHVRIEHRVVPAGPSIADAIANAALFYGLSECLTRELERDEPFIPFQQAKDNFYQAARHGLKAVVSWRGGERVALRSLLLDELLPRSREGLAALGLDRGESETYLDIVAARVESGQNGCQWQRRFVERNGADMPALTSAYLRHQETDRPVHEWSED
jgi:hypothetical protein